jgi:hypothetical protein
VVRDGTKIVGVTPAGRRRYLRLLIPYVLSCPWLDRYDLWVNTPDAADLAFLEAVAGLDPRIRLVRLPDAVPAAPRRIRHFWPLAMDADTLYLRFDDDVVWLSPGFFDTLLTCRLARPDAFMVAPLVINNALGSFVLQTFGKIVASRGLGPDRFDPTGWHSSSFAQSLHRLLLEIVAAGELGRLDCGRLPISANCFSINCVSWFGRDIAAVGGRFPASEDEEAAAGCTLALRARRINLLETAAVAAHFAFYTQRLALDASDLLAAYGGLAATRPELEPWRARVEALYADFETRFPGHDDAGGFRPWAQPRRRNSLLRRLTGTSKPTRPPPVLTAARGPHF